MDTSTVDYAIKITNVSKRYRLGQIGGGTLQRDLASWWARKRGKEDPNKPIGSLEWGPDDYFMALDGINLTVRPGEAVGIIGRNGAGKSTLLKLLSRVTGPTEGEIDIYGRITSMLEIGTGFNGELTGRENVYMNGAILGMSRAEIEAKMEDIVEFSEVRDFIDTPVKRYSSGMYVKLAFSVAAHLDNEIMIMDEVLAVGDVAFQKKCLEKMREKATSEGRTVLYVSHNMETIRKLCDRCIVMNNGRIIFDGDVEKAIEVYLGKDHETKAKKSFTRQDYSNCSEWIQILEAELDHPDCRYRPGENVGLRLICRSSHTLKNVFFRFHFVAANGARVGSSTTKNGVDIQALQESSVNVMIPSFELIPGEYMVEISIYTSDELEKYGYKNTLKNGLWLEITNELTESYQWLWWEDEWGHTLMAGTEVEVEHE